MPLGYPSKMTKLLYYDGLYYNKIIQIISKGFGFVRFNDETEMMHCLNEMNGAMGLGQRPIRLNNAAPKKYVYLLLI